MFTEKKPLAPYGLTQRYPAGMLLFIINMLNAIILLITPKHFPFYQVLHFIIQAFLGKKSSLPLCLIIVYPAFPPSPLLCAYTLPRIGTLQMGPGAWSRWGRGICRYQS